MSFLYKLQTKNNEIIKLPQVFHQFLIVNGAWPTDGAANKFKLRLYNLFGWIVFLNMAFINVFEIASVFANLTDLIRGAQSFSTALTGLFIVVRSLYFRVFSKQLTTLFEIFSKEIWIDGKKYAHNVNKCDRFMRPVFVYFVCIFVTLISYGSLPIIVFLNTNQSINSPDKLLPYPLVFPYDVQESTAYVTTYISALHAGWVIVSHFYAHDAILLLFVSYLCGQLEILHGDIARLIPECHAEWQKAYDKTKNYSMDYNVQHNSGQIKLLQDMYTKRLNRLSARHGQLISFSDILNDFFSFPLLINIINSTFLICFSGFQFLISGTTSFRDFIMFLSLFLSVMLQLFVICNCGNHLISCSSETALYLYLCNWEGGKLSNQSPLLMLPKDMNVASLNDKLPLWKFIKYFPAGKDFRNKLRFMIMRSHRPLKLNAMNFTIISLESFKNILSTSMSYFALLKTFLDKQN